VLVLPACGSSEGERATERTGGTGSGSSKPGGGHELFVANGSDVGSALSFQSVRSVPFLIDELAPQLATAVAGTGGTSGSTAASGASSGG
jgi:hypothetical protein